jgi:hypothetical protein
VHTTPSPKEAAEAQESAGRRADVLRVASWMEGSFTSGLQSAQDPEFRDVRIHAVKIWPDRQDGVWLYVEQALAEAMDKPYRQRVYRVFVQPNGLIVVEVFVLPGQSPLKYAGWWRKPAAFEDLSPKGLGKKDGCELVLRKVSDVEWSGGTVGNGCPTDLQGAVYATSEVWVSPEGIRVLDRGFDRAGKQVWGSTKGAYEFVRE